MSQVESPSAGTDASDADTSVAAAVRAPVAGEEDPAPQAGQPLQKADSETQDAAPEPGWTRRLRESQTEQRRMAESTSLQPKTPVNPR